MKRFSKMFSVMMLVPSAWVASAMYCACMSVGKPGYSSVEMSAALELAFAADADGVLADVAADAALFELREQRAEMRGVAAVDVEIAAGDGAGDEEGSGLDAVGIDAVARAVELVHALHGDGGGACAFNLRAHGDEQGGEVGDFGLAGAVFEDGLAFGEDGGHQQVFGAGDGDLFEDDARALEAELPLLGARASR